MVNEPSGRNQQKEKLSIGCSAFAILVLALLVGFLFSAAGAGMYGSPFAGKPLLTCLRWIVIVSISPLALAFGTFKGSQLPKATGALLVASALVSAALGQLDDFRWVWEWVYLLFVWMPMSVLAFYLFSRPGLTLEMEN